MAFGKQTYDASGNEMRESVLDILKNISPNEDNFLTTHLGTAPAATNTLHEWNLFNEARATSTTPVIEGADTIYTDLQTETRSSNRLEILDSPVKLSRTRASIANITGADEMGVEKERALTRLKNRMEYDTINGVLAAGSSGVSRGMAGIDGCISTNVTAFSSGQSFTETILNDMVQASWTAVGAEYVMDTLLAPVVIKRRVATFGTNLTRNIQASDLRLTKEVRVYDSEVGPTIKIIAHKDIRKTAGTLTTYGIRSDAFEYSFLVGSGEPHWEDRAVSGDYNNAIGVYITELTLVSYGQAASVKSTGFATGL
jgi:hypothetical protein